MTLLMIVGIILVIYFSVNIIYKNLSKSEKYYEYIKDEIKDRDNFYGVYAANLKNKHHSA